MPNRHWSIRSPHARQTNRCAELLSTSGNKQVFSWLLVADSAREATHNGRGAGAAWSQTTAGSSLWSTPGWAPEVRRSFVLNEQSLPLRDPSLTLRWLAPDNRRLAIKGGRLAVDGRRLAVKGGRLAVDSGGAG